MGIIPDAIVNRFKDYVKKKALDYVKTNGEEYAKEWAKNAIERWVKSTLEKSGWYDKDGTVVGSYISEIINEIFEEEKPFSGFTKERGGRIDTNGIELEARRIIRRFPENYSSALDYFLTDPIVKRTKLDKDSGKDKTEKIRIFKKVLKEEVEARRATKPLGTPILISPKNPYTAVKEERTYASVGGGIGAAAKETYRRGGLGKIEQRAGGAGESEGFARQLSAIEQAAANKGKRELKKYAYQVYKVEVGDIKGKVTAAEKEEKEAAENYKKKIKIVHNEINRLRKEVHNLQPRPFAEPDKDVGEAAKQAISAASGMMQRAEYEEIKFATEEMAEAKQKLDKAKENLKQLEDISLDPNKLYDFYLKKLQGRVTDLMGILKREYGPVVAKWNTREEAPLKNVEQELMGEAAYLSDYYSKLTGSSFKDVLKHAGYYTRAIGAGTAEVGSIWSNLLENTWTFLTGPWLLGIAFLIVQWFFYGAYVNPIPNVTLSMMSLMAIGSAFLVLALNLQAAKQPLDWVAHAVSGGIIAFSINLLIIALGLTWSVSGTIYFVVVGILWLLGVFQFYQLGGFRVIFQISIIILIFAYIALGPYSAQYQTVKEQVKAPLEQAYYALKGSAENLWLLGTNPTEWYARQQVVNVRSESSYVKAVEVQTFDILPPAVPHSLESKPSFFSTTAIIRNDGPIIARDVNVSVDCLGDCNYTTDTYSTVLKSELKPQEATVVSVNKIKAGVAAKGREAETTLGKVRLNITYRYSNNASLLVEVMNQNEINRRLSLRENVFRNVVATDKGTPGKLSLNVGPQPLQAVDLGETLNQNRADVPTTGVVPSDNNAQRNKAQILVSVSNGRSDGNVILKKGTQIFIYLPTSIGSGMQCEGSLTFSKTTEGQYEKGVVTVEPPQTDKIEIKPSEFSSIYYFFCSFDIATNIQDVRTELIRAELPDYEFNLIQEKNVQFIVPLGILPPRNTLIPGGGTTTQFPGTTGSTSGAAFGTVVGTSLNTNQQATANAVANSAHIERDFVASFLGIGSGNDLDKQINEQLGVENFNTLILRMAMQESSLKHCIDGSTNCVDRNGVYSDNNDWGIMQINYYTSSFTKDDIFQDGWNGNVVVSGSQRTLSACSQSKSPYEINCNIQLGIWQLVDKYKSAQSILTANEANLRAGGCYDTYASYQPWKLALQAYNGLTCDKINYVSDVVNRKEVSFQPFTSLSGDQGSKIVTAALAFKGTTWVFGGESTSGIDCSGLVHQSYKNAGFSWIPDRTADGYYNEFAIRTESFTRDQYQPGWVCFWRSSSGNVDHTAIYAGNGNVIDSAKSVGSVSERPIDSVKKNPDLFAGCFPMKVDNAAYVDANAGDEGYVE